MDHTYSFKLLSEKRIKLDESDEPKSPMGGKAPRKQLATKRVLHSFHEKARHVKVSPMKESQSQVSGLGSPNFSIRYFPLPNHSDPNFRSNKRLGQSILCSMNTNEIE